MRSSLDFYFDFISPFGYFASLQVDDLAARHQRDCRWQSMLLGISVLKVMGMRPLTEIPLKGDYLRVDLDRYLRRHKLSLARTRDAPPSSSLPAGRVFHLIDQTNQTLAKQVAKAILDAYWKQGANIGSSESVIAIAQRQAPMPRRCNGDSQVVKLTVCYVPPLTAHWPVGCSAHLSSSLTTNRFSDWRRWNWLRIGSPQAAGDRLLRKPWCGA